MPEIGTYVYAIVAAPRRPRLPGRRMGLDGAGPVRLLDLPAQRRRTAAASGRWAVVADVALERYGADAIDKRMSDVDWISRAAIGHEHVVESFVGSAALLPMKLFTIFTGDDRVRDHMTAEARTIERMLARVAGHQEWGVRVAQGTSQRVAPAQKAVSSGTSYLLQKKRQRDEKADRLADERLLAKELFERLAARAAHADRRSGAENQHVPSALLMDAVFLVTRNGAARFRTAVRTEAGRLRKQGYGVTLTGPWPPYSFVRD